MKRFKTIDVDVRQSRLRFGLTLFDGFTGKSRLEGEVHVRLKNAPDLPKYRPITKTPESAYMFVDLPDGSYVVQMESDVLTPYYLPREFPFSLPLLVPPWEGTWPAFPEKQLANENLPPDSLLQPGEYRAQRERSTLWPGTGYPFPGDATLIRGTVRNGGATVSGVTLTAWPDASEDNPGFAQPPNPGSLEARKLPHGYVTGPDGQYVLCVKHSQKMAEWFIVRATRQGFGPKQVVVRVHRGETAFADVSMA